MRRYVLDVYAPMGQAVLYLEITGLKHADKCLDTMLHCFCVVLSNTGNHLLQFIVFVPQIQIKGGILSLQVTVVCV